MPPQPQLPPSLLVLILSHLPTPYPAELHLVSRLFHTLCSTSVVLSSPASYETYLGTSDAFDQPKAGWASTTHLTLHIGGWSDGVGQRWLPRMTYLLRGDGHGLGSNVRSLEVAFGGEGWVASTGTTLGALVAKGMFPRLEQLVVSEYVARDEIKPVQPTDSKPKPKTRTKAKGRGRVASSPTPPLAAPSDPFAPTPATTKFLHALPKPTSSQLHTLTLPLSHLVHPSSPFSSVDSLPAYISSVLVTVPASMAEAEDVQQLFDWLGEWLTRLADVGMKTRGKGKGAKGKAKEGKQGGGRVVDLRELSECVEEEGWQVLGELGEQVQAWEVLV